MTLRNTATKTMLTLIITAMYPRRGLVSTCEASAAEGMKVVVSFVRVVGIDSDTILV